jgi:predicted site-specific integrase-resolvase
MKTNATIDNSNPPCAAPARRGGQAGPRVNPWPVSRRRFDPLRDEAAEALMRRLKISRETMARRIAAGELPEPETVDGRLVFNRLRLADVMARAEKRRVAARARRGRLTLAEAAARLGMTPQALTDAARRGDLPAPEIIGGRPMMIASQIRGLAFRQRRREAKAAARRGGEKERR